MRTIDPNAIYNRNDLAEVFEVDPRTVSTYYTKGLPKKKGIRGNCTTGRQVLDWIENGGLETSKKPTSNPKLLKFKQSCM